MATSCGEHQRMLKSADADARLDFARRAFEQKKIHPGHNRAHRHRDRSSKAPKRRRIALPARSSTTRTRITRPRDSTSTPTTAATPKVNTPNCTLLRRLRILSRLTRTSARPKRYHQGHRRATGISRLLPPKRQSARGTASDIRASGQAHPQGAAKRTALLQPRHIRRQQLRVVCDCGPQRHQKITPTPSIRKTSRCSS